MNKLTVQEIVDRIKVEIDEGCASSEIPMEGFWFRKLEGCNEGIGGTKDTVVLVRGSEYTVVRQG